MYEYDSECLPAKHPRNCLPYAVICFERDTSLPSDVSMPTMGTGSHQWLEKVATNEKVNKLPMEDCASDGDGDWEEDGQNEEQELEEAGEDSDDELSMVDCVPDEDEENEEGEDDNDDEEEEGSDDCESDFLGVSSLMDEMNVAASNDTANVQVAGDIDSDNSGSPSRSKHKNHIQDQLGPTSDGEDSSSNQKPDSDLESDSGDSPESSEMSGDGRKRSSSSESESDAINDNQKDSDDSQSMALSSQEHTDTGMSRNSVASREQSDSDQEESDAGDSSASQPSEEQSDSEGDPGAIEKRKSKPLATSSEYDKSRASSSSFSSQRHSHSGSEADTGDEPRSRVSSVNENQPVSDSDADSDADIELDEHNSRRENSSDSVSDIDPDDSASSKGQITAGHESVSEPSEPESSVYSSSSSDNESESELNQSHGGYIVKRNEVSGRVSVYIEPSDRSRDHRGTESSKDQTLQESESPEIDDDNDSASETPMSQPPSDMEELDEADSEAESSTSKKVGVVRACQSDTICTHSSPDHYAVNHKQTSSQNIESVPVNHKQTTSQNIDSVPVVKPHEDLESKVNRLSLKVDASVSGTDGLHCTCSSNSASDTKSEMLKMERNPPVQKQAASCCTNHGHELKPHVGVDSKPVQLENSSSRSAIRNLNVADASEEQKAVNLAAESIKEEVANDAEMENFGESESLEQCGKHSSGEESDSDVSVKELEVEKVEHVMIDLTSDCERDGTHDGQCDESAGQEEPGDSNVSLADNGASNESDHESMEVEHSDPDLPNRECSDDSEHEGSDQEGDKASESGNDSEPSGKDCDKGSSAAGSEEDKDKSDAESEIETNSVVDERDKTGQSYELSESEQSHKSSAENVDDSDKSDGESCNESNRETNRQEINTGAKQSKDGSDRDTSDKGSGSEGEGDDEEAANNPDSMEIDPRPKISDEPSDRNDSKGGSSSKSNSDDGSDKGSSSSGSASADDSKSDAGSESGSDKEPNSIDVDRLTKSEDSGRKHSDAKVSSSSERADDSEKSGSDSDKSASDSEKSASDSENNSIDATASINQPAGSGRSNKSSDNTDDLDKAGAKSGRDSDDQQKSMDGDAESQGGSDNDGLNQTDMLDPSDKGSNTSERSDESKNSENRPNIRRHIVDLVSGKSVPLTILGDNAAAKCVRHAKVKRKKSLVKRKASHSDFDDSSDDDVINNSAPRPRHKKPLKSRGKSEKQPTGSVFDQSSAGKRDQPSKVVQSKDQGFDVGARSLDVQKDASPSPNDKETPPVTVGATAENGSESITENEVTITVHASQSDTGFLSEALDSRSDPTANTSKINVRENKSSGNPKASVKTTSEMLDHAKSSDLPLSDNTNEHDGEADLENTYMMEEFDVKSLMSDVPCEGYMSPMTDDEDSMKSPDAEADDIIQNECASPEINQHGPNSEKQKHPVGKTGVEKDNESSNHGLEGKADKSTDNSRQMSSSFRNPCDRREHSGRHGRERDRISRRHDQERDRHSRRHDQEHDRHSRRLDVEPDRRRFAPRYRYGQRDGCGHRPWRHDRYSDKKAQTMEIDGRDSLEASKFVGLSPTLSDTPFDARHSCDQPSTPIRNLMDINVPLSRSEQMQLTSRYCDPSFVDRNLQVLSMEFDTTDSETCHRTVVLDYNHGKSDVDADPDPSFEHIMQGHMAPIEHSLGGSGASVQQHLISHEEADRDLQPLSMDVVSADSESPQVSAVVYEYLHGGFNLDRHDERLGHDVTKVIHDAIHSGQTSVAADILQVVPMDLDDEDDDNYETSVDCHQEMNNNDTPKTSGHSSDVLDKSISNIQQMVEQSQSLIALRVLQEKLKNAKDDVTRAAFLTAINLVNHDLPVDSNSSVHAPIPTPPPSPTKPDMVLNIVTDGAKPSTSSKTPVSPAVAESGVKPLVEPAPEQVKAMKMPAPSVATSRRKVHKSGKNAAKSTKTLRKQHEGPISIRLKVDLSLPPEKRPIDPRPALSSMYGKQLVIGLRRVRFGVRRPPVTASSGVPNTPISPAPDEANSTPDHATNSKQMNDGILTDELRRREARRIARAIQKERGAADTSGKSCEIPAASSKGSPSKTPKRHKKSLANVPNSKGSPTTTKNDLVKKGSSSVEVGGKPSNANTVKTSTPVSKTVSKSSSKLPHVPDRTKAKSNNSVRRTPGEGAASINKQTGNSLPEDRCESSNTCKKRILVGLSGSSDNKRSVPNKHNTPNVKTAVSSGSKPNKYTSNTSDKAGRTSTNGTAKILWPSSAPVSKEHAKVAKDKSTMSECSKPKKRRLLLKNGTPHKVVKSKETVKSRKDRCVETGSEKQTKQFDTRKVVLGYGEQSDTIEMKREEHNTLNAEQDASVAGTASAIKRSDLRHSIERSRARRSSGQDRVKLKFRKQEHEDDTASMSSQSQSGIAKAETGRRKTPSPAKSSREPIDNAAGATNGRGYKRKSGDADMRHVVVKTLKLATEVDQSQAPKQSTYNASPNVVKEQECYAATTTSSDLSESTDEVTVSRDQHGDKDPTRKRSRGSGSSTRGRFRGSFRGTFRGPYRGGFGGYRGKSRGGFRETNRGGFRGSSRRDGVPRSNLDQLQDRPSVFLNDRGDHRGDHERRQYESNDHGGERQPNQHGDHYREPRQHHHPLGHLERPIDGDRSRRTSQSEIIPEIVQNEIIRMRIDVEVAERARILFLQREERRPRRGTSHW